ncbi:MAG: DNA polymerase III subunit delta [Chloroflexota bacterium]
MTTTFYIFYGSDDLSIDEAVARLRDEMGSGTEAEMNITDFDGTVASVPEIINAVSSFPFLADNRMAIVRGLLGWLTRKGAGQMGKDALSRLEEALPNLPAHSRLILVERGDLPDKNPIVKLANSHSNGFIRRFDAPKNTTEWIIQRARSAYKARIDNRAAAALAAVTGEDLRRADNELVKLVSYVDEDQPITEQDVAALTPYVPEADIFKMVDAIAEGRGQFALEMLHRLMADKKQDPFGLFGMITRQFRHLLLAREHLASGGGAGELPRLLGVPGFVANNIVRQSRAFSLDDLERVYQSLQETDFKMKTGRIDPALALDLFVASIAR